VLISFNRELADYLSLEPAYNAVEIVPTRFLSGPAYLDNGTMYIPNKPPVAYFGRSDLLIDDAWNDLTQGTAVFVAY
jgi:hypothetical protein